MMDGYRGEWIAKWLRDMANGIEAGKYNNVEGHLDTIMRQLEPLDAFERSELLPVRVLILYFTLNDEEDKQ